jgi:hypothetical protein
MLDIALFDQMQNSFRSMKDPVRLILFTRDFGCDICPGALEVARAVKARAPKVALEVYDLVMDRDKAQQYGVQRVPVFVLQGANERVVRFSGLAEGVFLRILLETLFSISSGKIWFPEKILRTLSHLEKDVPIQVFVETDCPQCRPVAETAIGLALESDLVSTDVIMANDFPDLIRKHSIKTLPRTIFGANLHMDGHVSESQFLEMIFEAEGVQASPDRRCLVCGTPSPDIICGSCKTKIQSEALDHKRKGERIRSD